MQQEVQEKTLKIAAIFICVIAVVSWVFFLDPYIYFNSDNVYLFALFQDLFEKGNSLKAWQLPNSPAFFPDMVLYAPFYFATRAMPASYLLFGIANIGLTLTLFVVAARRLLPKPGSPLRDGLALGTISAFAVLGGLDAATVAIKHFCFAGHTAIVGTCLALCLVMLKDRDGRNPGWPTLIVAGLALAAALASDRLMWVFFSLPFGIATGLAAWRARDRALRGRALFLIGWCGAASGVGYQIDHRLHRTLNISNIMDFIPQHTHRETLREFVHAFPDLFRFGPIATFFYVGLLGLGTFELARRALRLLPHWRQETEEESQAGFESGIFLNYLTISCLGTISAPLVMRLFLSSECFRYCGPIFLFPLFGLILLGERLLRGHGAWFTSGWRPAFALLLLSLALVGELAQKRLAHAENMFSYNPPLVQCLDGLVQKGVIHDGIADYWTAKFVTFLSRQGTRVIQVWPPLEWIHWGDSLRWYPENTSPLDRPMRIDYVIETSLDHDKIVQKFGAPSETLLCDDKKVHVFRDPKAQYALSHFFRGL